MSFSIRDEEDLHTTHLKINTIQTRIVRARRWAYIYFIKEKTNRSIIHPQLIFNLQDSIPTVSIQSTSQVGVPFEIYL